MEQTKPETRSILAWLDVPFLDFWLPVDALHAVDPSDLLRMRIVSALLHGMAVLALIFGIVDASSGLYVLATPAFAGVPVAGLILWRMRRGASLTELAFSSSAVTYAVLVFNVSLNGGLEAPGLVFLPLVPTLSLLLGARRLARAWLVVCTFTIAAAFGIENLLELPFPQAMSPQQLPLNRTLVMVALCLMVFGAFLLNMAFANWLQVRLLDAEAERLDRILDAAGDAILRLDTTWTISTANAAALRLFDVPQLDGTPAGDLLSDVRRLEHAAGAVVLEAHTADERFQVEATCTFLGTGFVLVIRDIRERMAAQLELERARDEAQAANLAKSRFLASMSHELRTPLNAVIGYAEMVGEEIDDGTPPEDSRDLDHIVGSARHLLALIDQVLDLAKVEAGRMEVERRDVPLSSFLAELESVGRTLAKNGSNQWRVALPAQAATVSLDEVRVRQIVLNLLSNAAKFCERGEIAFEVTYEDERLTMAVSDTGIGMTPEELTSVWEEFVQAERSTQREYGGTGLGLPLARRLTSLLSGTLGATSERGVGTRFVVELPVPLVHMVSPKAATSPEGEVAVAAL